MSYSEGGLADAMAEVAAGDFYIHDGEIITSGGLSLRGYYTHSVNGVDVVEDKNMIVDEGLLYLLTAGLMNGSKFPNWYIALNGINYTPSASLKGSEYPTSAGEIVSTTDGYVEAARQGWVPDSPSGAPSISNASNPAKFTIAATDEVVVHGAALLSGSVRGSTSDKLLSVVKFDKPRTLYDGDVFSMTYRVELSQR